MTLRGIENECKETPVPVPAGVGAVRRRSWKGRFPAKSKAIRALNQGNEGSWYAVDRRGTQGCVALVALLALLHLLVVFFEFGQFAENAGESMHDAARVVLSS